MLKFVIIAHIVFIEVQKMKSLSIRAPYAMLIADGTKTIEWRSWSTNYRGKLLICSSAHNPASWGNALITGHAICTVDLINCVPFSKSHLLNAYLDKMPEPAGYAWILGNLQIIKPIKIKGKLKLFNVDDKLITPIDVNSDDLIDYWQSLNLIS